MNLYPISSVIILSEHRAHHCFSAGIGVQTSNLPMIYSDDFFDRYKPGQPVVTFPTWSSGNKVSPDVNHRATETDLANVNLFLLQSVIPLPILSRQSE